MVGYLGSAGWRARATTSEWVGRSSLALLLMTTLKTPSQQQPGRCHLLLFHNMMRLPLNVHDWTVGSELEMLGEPRSGIGKE